MCFMLLLGCAIWMSYVLCKVEGPALHRGLGPELSLSGGNCVEDKVFRKGN